MSRYDDATARLSEALREALEWASDLDAGLTREAAAGGDVEAHVMHVEDAPSALRPAAEGA